MGMVFKATDLRKIEAQDKEPYVALKVLNQDFQSNPMALVSLQRETKRAQTLSHPNIIKVFDFDRDGGHVFMSMEYLQGKPLSHLIKEYPEGMPFKQAWPIIHDMADALRHAHKKNIVHSDFKPGNVFIDENDEVRVLDFGIACAIGRSDKDHQDATVFNARSLGAYTPAYASLEQLQNSDPDPRDDLYALACVSYELLTGKHPFGRLSAEKAMEVNLQVKPIAKLSHRQMKGLQKALAFEQTARTKTVDAFLGALGPRSTVFYGLWGTGIFTVGLFAANIYLSMLAPPTVVEAPKVDVQLSVEQQQKVQDLLELALIHADVGYLTAPTGSNALWAYQEVLKIDPYNKNATEGIIGIADTLEQQAWEAYEKNNRAEALKKVQEGLEANPSHKGLLSLRDKLRTSQ
jgi:serine/threonine protein kinase